MGKMTNNYLKQAPLSFVGQKRNFVKHYVKVLNENIPGDGEGWTIVDAFGGSGLLSHVSKRIKPKARVIYNDFDNYAERIANIESTERLRVKLLKCCEGVGKNDKLSVEVKSEVVDAIKMHGDFVDWLSVSAWLKFAGSSAVYNVEDLASQNILYNRIRQSPIVCALDYFDGVEKVKADFKSLLNEHKGNNKALFVLDPPYICTDQAKYTNEWYFDLIDFLDLADIVRAPFVLFSSSKSEILKFIDWSEKTGKYKELHNPKSVSIKGVVNGQSRYTDNMLYKFKAIS